MMGVDNLLAERAIQGDPVRVAMAGCGFMGRGLVNQIVNSVPGMTLAASAVRNPDSGFKALIDAGYSDAIAAEGVPALKAHIAHAERLLPIGAAERCTLMRDVPKDATVTYDDVVLPKGRLLDQLLEAQCLLDVGVPPGLMAHV
jgi:predicted homoserine dehydrogenase-like protein